MRKVSICFLIFAIALFSFSGCLSQTQNSAEFCDGQIIYNGHCYIYSDDKISYCFTPATENFNPRNYADDTKIVGRSTYFTSIHTAWENDFGDNVLQAYGLGAWHAYYFKEGFELPNYKTLAIDELFFKGESIVKFSNQQVFWDDIVDLENLIISDAFPEYYDACYGTILNYDCILFGGYHVNVIDGEVFIQIPEYKETTYGRVRDEYQPYFTNAIKELESNNEK